MSTKTNLLYVEARCSKTKLIWYQRYDLAVDGKWVLSKGEKTMSGVRNGENTPSAQDINLAHARIGPLFKCPHCGNTSFVKCGKCGKYSCYEGNGTMFYCGNPTCGNSGEVKGRIKEIGSDIGGSGQ